MDSADGGSERAEHMQQEHNPVEEHQPESIQAGDEGGSPSREVRGNSGAGAGERSQAEGNLQTEGTKVEEARNNATAAAEGQTERSAKRTRQKSRKAREEDQGEGSEDEPAVKLKAGGSSGRASGTAEAKSATKRADDRGFELHGGKLFVSVKRKQMPAGTSQAMVDYFVDNRLHIDTLQVKLVCPQPDGPSTERMVTPWVEFRKNTNGTPDVRPHVPAEALSAAMEALHNNDMWFQFAREGRNAVLTVTRKERLAADYAAGTSGTKRGPNEPSGEQHAKRQRAGPSDQQQQGTREGKQKAGDSPRGTAEATSAASGKKPHTQPASSDRTPPRHPSGGQSSGGRSQHAAGSWMQGQPGGGPSRWNATADELAAEALMGLNRGVTRGANPGDTSTAKSHAKPETERPPIPPPFPSNDTPGARSVDRKAAVEAARKAEATAAAKKSVDAAAAKKAADAAAAKKAADAAAKKAADAAAARRAADAAAAKKAANAAAVRDAAAAAAARDVAAAAAAARDVAAAAAAAARDAAAAAAARDTTAAREAASAAACGSGNAPMPRLFVLVADLVVLEADQATWSVWGGAAVQSGHREQLQQWITLLDDFRQAAVPRCVRQAVDVHTADIRGERPDTWLTRTYVASRVAEMAPALGELLVQFRRGALVVDGRVLGAVEAAVRGIAQGDSCALAGAMCPLLIGLEQVGR